jgi:cytochrome c553
VKVSAKDKSMLASILLVVYVFIAFFAVNLHHHKSGLEFRDFKFKKSYNTFSQDSATAEFTDCLSCHLLHDGKNLLPQEFQFSIFSAAYFQPQLSYYKAKFSTLQHAQVQLRGPPSVFIY